MELLSLGRSRAQPARRPLATVAVTVLGTALALAWTATRSPAQERADPAPAYDTEPAEIAALRLLGVAKQDLSAQRIEPARRALELLIARYPDSASAAAARRELFHLYGADAQISGAPPSRSTTVPASAPSSGLQGAIQAGPAASTSEAVSGWRTSVVSIRRLQDEFRNSIGDRIFFSAGSDELGSRARAVLAAQAAWLVQRPQVEISIEGHADDAMAGADNEAIAASRARAIRDRLIEAGVEPGRIALTSKGGSDPIAICSDSDCAAQNRRAVIAVGVRRFETGLGPDPFSPTRPPAP